MKDGGVMENIRGMNLVVDTTSEWSVLLDAMARHYDEGKPAGQIRNVCLSDCSFTGPGRIWLEGTDDQPLENIRIQNIDWNINGPIPSPAVTKPTGSARTRSDPSRPAYEQEQAHILAIKCPGVNIQGVRLSGSHANRVLLREC